jgi:hypothetical protein
MNIPLNLTIEEFFQLINYLRRNSPLQYPIDFSRDRIETTVELLSNYNSIQFDIFETKYHFEIIDGKSVSTEYFRTYSPAALENKKKYLTELLSIWL